MYYIFQDRKSIHVSLRKAINKQLISYVINCISDCCTVQCIDLL